MKTRLCSFNRTKGNALSLWWGQIMIILLLWSFFAPAALGQTKLWDKTIGGSNSDALTSLQQTKDGGYILGGSSFSGATGDKTHDNLGICDAAFCSSDYWIVKLDDKGNKAWDKTFGGNKTDILTVLQQTSDGGYILGGYSSSDSSGDKTEASRGSYDYWVVKLNAAGEKEWDKTLGANLAEALSALQQTSDGGYILGGSSPSWMGYDKTEDSRGHNDYWIVKLDAAGNKEWDRTYGGNEEDKFGALKQTSDGGYILGGSASSDISGEKSEDIRGSFDYWAVKIDTAGNKQWDKTFGGDKTDILTALQPTSDGGYILGGYTASDDNGDKTEASKGSSDYWVVKLNATGEKQWDKTLGGSGQEISSSLQQTSDGGYILGGYSDSGISGDKSQASLGLADYWVVKLDTAGNKAWDKTYGGSTLDGLAALQQTREGGFILGGWSESEISGDKSEASRGRTDYWVVKITDNVPAPQLLSFSPSEGLPGTSVTITGKNLLTTYAVRFNGLKAKIEIVSDEVVIATVPANATSGKITVETAGGKVNNSPTFTVLQPAIAAFLPFQGEAGSRVYLVGDRLTTAKSVYFNGVKAPKIKVFFDWALYAVIPEGATTGMIQVVLAGGGQAITKSHFTVTTPEPSTLAEEQLVRTEMPAGKTATPEEAKVMAFPNPFQQQVSFSFTLAQPQPVTVMVYDLLGREVSLLYQGEVRAHQPYLMAWRPKAQQPAGLYIIRLQAPGQIIQKKIMLAR